MTTETATFVPFNVNSMVRIKLNDKGRQILKDAHYRRWQHREKPPYEFRLPTEDEDGWSRWSLWSLMQDFGEHVYLGCIVPFETQIEFQIQPD